MERKLRMAFGDVEVVIPSVSGSQGVVPMLPVLVLAQHVQVHRSAQEGQGDQQRAESAETRCASNAVHLHVYRINVGGFESIP